MALGVEQSIPFTVQSATLPVSTMWSPHQRGTAEGSFALTSDDPFTGTQSQVVTFATGDGEWGVSNQGLNHWGINFVAN